MKRAAIFVAAVCCAVPMRAPSLPQASYALALHRAVAGRNATAVVVDVASGRVLAAEHADRAATAIETPGSVLKPFYLQAALRDGVVQPGMAVHCSRQLHIAGHTLNCSHPAEPAALAAKDALAYSCNTYFATLAEHMTPQQIAEALHRYGFGAAPHLFGNEAAVSFSVPEMAERRELFVLGVAGLRVSVAQVAVAYQRLALEHRNHAEAATDATVWQGMVDSVRFGSSDNAMLPGLVTAGKTGTAANESSAATHGWFAGIAPAEAPRVVVVIYVSSGNGGDAALMARNFYQSAMPLLVSAK